MVCPPQDCTGSEPVERGALNQDWSGGEPPALIERHEQAEASP